MIGIIINLNIWILTIVGYVIYNLYTKNLKLEQIVQEQSQKLTQIGEFIDVSDRTLKEVDKLGAFRSDDEIGFFFNTMKEIQEVLNQLKK